ncbi:unnamed protein product [Didymodactylos carnosus]|uniref:Uncharacterized protein n=1 Tax=Didymodactylos carnosus TaxID=1234261 RepID=A0A814SNT1_9BILA|nr:unnamed protein product [Didymodactylos carnosus]CAF1148953.1 unnamed protein product [Didymodactylos carnosus]CAF3900014.1 unnamed protein product [Didymodactylos carnosus]CAF3912484.1 unnamed protein product [Didymodactylos carnosus]
MFLRNTEIFPNPIQIARPITVNEDKRLKYQHSVVADRLNRPKTVSGSFPFNRELYDIASVSSKKSYDSDDDLFYDTDIEEEQEKSKDYTCLGMYHRRCKQLDIVPSNQYIRHHMDESLNMKYYGLGARGIRGMIPSLTVNQHIINLDLSNNGLKDEGAIYLSYIIKDNTAITDLNLSYNFLEIEGTKAICEIFRHNITVKNLILDGNLFNDECARLFSELISSTGQLRTLRLSRNKFGPISGKYFGPALAENTTMDLLDLSWNSISEKGAVAFFKGVQKNVYMKTLNLSWNGVSKESGKVLLQALKENNTLLELDLSHNRITPEVATFIGRGLSKNEGLKVLKIAGNPLETAGCYALLKPLIKSETSKLDIIDLTDINLNQDCIDVLNILQQHRVHLQVLTGTSKPPVLRTKPKHVHPFQKLRNLIERQNVDLLHLFKSIDSSNDIMNTETDSNGIISKEKFCQALEVDYFL